MLPPPMSGRSFACLDLLWSDVSDQGSQALCARGHPHVDLWLTHHSNSTARLGVPQLIIVSTVRSSISLLGANYENEYEDRNARHGDGERPALGRRHDARCAMRDAMASSSTACARPACTAGQAVPPAPPDPRTWFFTRRQPTHSAAGSAPACAANRTNPRFQPSRPPWSHSCVASSNALNSHPAWTRCRGRHNSVHITCTACSRRSLA
jgi:hypothetical protein